MVSGCWSKILPSVSFSLPETKEFPLSSIKHQGTGISYGCPIQLHFKNIKPPVSPPAGQKLIFEKTKALIIEKKPALSRIFTELKEGEEATDSPYSPEGTPSIVA